MQVQVNEEFRAFASLVPCSRDHFALLSTDNEKQDHTHSAWSDRVNSSLQGGGDGQVDQEAGLERLSDHDAGGCQICWGTDFPYAVAESCGGRHVRLP